MSRKVAISGLAIFVIAVLVICFVPLMNTAYTAIVDYEDTETYYEDEPYQETETYVEAVAEPEIISWEDLQKTFF